MILPDCLWSSEEFHFGVPERGLASRIWHKTANQNERGTAYRYYVENAAANPSIIGNPLAFNGLTRPATGRFDGREL